MARFIFLGPALTETIDAIEIAGCVCGAGTDRDKPPTWEFCQMHKLVRILKEHLQGNDTEISDRAPCDSCGKPSAIKYWISAFRYLCGPCYQKTDVTVALREGD